MNKVLNELIKFIFEETEDCELRFLAALKNDDKCSLNRMGIRLGQIQRIKDRLDYLMDTMDTE